MNALAFRFLQINLEASDQHLYSYPKFIANPNSIGMGFNPFLQTDSGTALAKQFPYSKI
jgi:hypothetical protein